MTYHYEIEVLGGNVEVHDDKLGLIGSSGGQTLTQTTKIRETTTNAAWLVGIGCYCAFGNSGDSVTVTVPTPTPTPPSVCLWPEVKIVTAGKGQSPTNNAKLSHSITGHIISPDAVRDTAHRIEICAGTRVTSVVSDSTGSATNTASGSLLCHPGACWGVVDVIEKYHSTSEDGSDRDTITLILK